MGGCLEWVPETCTVPGMWVTYQRGEAEKGDVHDGDFQKV